MLSPSRVGLKTKKPAHALGMAGKPGSSRKWRLVPRSLSASWLMAVLMCSTLRA